jgi:asparagine synthase (glutamine-hydrolysing)
MRSDVSIGTALSGGIDSSATISTMNYVSNNLHGEFSNDWQHAYVASFPGTSLDETREAKMVVDKININATYLNIDPLKDIEKIFYYTYMFEEMFISTPLPFIQLYKEVKKSGTTVTLDGHGSDELFGGYSFEISHKLNDDFPNIFEMIKTLETINNGKGINQKIGLKDAYPFFKTSFRGQFGVNKKPIPQLDYFNNQLYKSSFQTILPTLLRNYDRYSMINGVEIRMPFLDHRIVSFAFSIPSSSKIKNGFSKSIIRDSMKGLIPDEIRIKKKKIGFHSPFGDWIRGSIKEWILDEMGSSDFKTCPFIDHKEVSKYINNIIFSKEASFVDGEVAWTKIMPYVWGKSLKYIK